jgi:hypothetical protein
MLSRGTHSLPYRLLLAALVTLAALGWSASASADVPAPGDFSPSVWSDKADYSPGEHVVLSGSNWQASESVHITVNDDAGSTWSRAVDVTADAAGNVTDEFDLPGWFVASYHVRAEGASGSVATYDFTDSNVKIDVAPANATLIETLYAASTNCTGAVKSGYPKTLTNSNGDNVGVGSNESLKVEAAATDIGGRPFKAWSSTDSFTVVAPRTICVPTSANNTNFLATYDAVPTINRVNASVTVNEGSPAANNGSWTDPDATDTVTLSASVGTVTKAGTNAAGTWTWSYTPPDGPTSPSPQVVTITADDGATTTSTTFNLTVNNVAPTVTLSAANVLSVPEGQTRTYSYTISDPGVDTMTPTTSCGANGTKVAASDTNTSTSGSFQCTFPDGPASSTVSAAVTDSDGAPSNTATQTVSVTNVAPAVTLSAANVLSVPEGQTQTYSYTITDPGVDTITGVTVSCGANGTQIGAETHTNTTGSFQCKFPDGPASSIVSASATDSDSATGTAATQTVTVNNVAPTVTLSAANVLSVPEGQTRTYSYTISDPGVDTVSSVAVSCGANGTQIGTETHTNTTGSFDCKFPDGPASSIVSASATDSDGATGTAATQTVNVSNVAPTVSLTGATNVSEGSTHTYTFTVTDPGVDTFTVDTGFPDCDAGATNNGTLVGGSLSVNAGGGSFQCTFSDGPTTANVKISVTDSDGGTDTASQSVDVVTVNNVAPTVTAPGNQSANEGASTSFSLGSFTDPGAADNQWSVDVDWGDGSTHTTFSQNITGSLGNQSHSYADGPADRTVSVTVTDKNNGTDTKTFSVHVNNVAPTVTLLAANDLSVPEGQTRTYSYTISDPGVDTVSAVTTSCGANGTKVLMSDTNSDTAGSFQCFFPDGAATSIVSASATDSDGATGNLATQTVSVTNVAPTVALSAANALSVPEGQTRTYSYTISDPGVDNVSSVAVSCGINGTQIGTETHTNTTGSFDCKFPDGPNSSTVSAGATDSDGVANDNTSTQTVTVNNVAPSVSLTGATTVDEGTTHTYTFTVTDPGVDTFTVDSGFPDCDALASNNGTLVAGTLSVNAGGGTFDCTFPDGPSTANVKIKVTDSDGASDTTSQAVNVVTVANVAPTVTAPANQNADEGAATSISLGSFTDPGPDATWAVDVDWGDGTAHDTFDKTTIGSLGTKTYTYADGPATRTVSVKVTDKDGASDTKTFAVTVANVAPTVTLSAANDLSVNEGSTHTYSYTISDPGVDTVSAVTTSCGDNGVKGVESNTDASGSFECTFPDGPDTSVVSASATDSDGDTGNLATQTVDIANVAPTVTLAPANDLSVNEGSTYTYSYTISDPGADTIEAVTPDCGTNGDTPTAETHTDAGGSFKCAFPDGHATSVVSISARDSDHETGNTDTQTVDIANVAPTVTLSSSNDLSVNEGSTHTYSYTISDPGTLETVEAVSPDCGANGDTPTAETHTDTAGSFDCTFPDGDASSVVSISATDSDHETGNTATQTVDIANVAPAVTLLVGNDLSVNEGSTHTYSYSISDPGADTIEAVSPDCGTNGDTPTADTHTDSSGSFKCTFPDGHATSVVSISATDSDHETGNTDTQTVDIANVAPTVTLSSSNDLSVNEGSTHTYSYTISDPGTLDTVEAVTPDCGSNGDTPTAETHTDSGGSFDCTFPDGTKHSTVSISATDSDHETGNTATQDVTINNVAPTVLLTGLADVTEGSTHTYTFTVTDPGTNDTFTASAGYPDCDAEATDNGELVADSYKTDADGGGSFKCFFPDGPKTAHVKMKVADSDGASATDSESVQIVAIANVAPTVALDAGNATTVSEGSVHTYSYTISDPGTLDTVEAVTPDCGANGTSSNAHNGNTSGSFDCTFPDGTKHSDVSISATDSDHETGNTATQDVTINNVAPTVTLAAGNDLTVNEGSTHTYSYTISDPGTLDTIEAVTPDCGANGDDPTDATNTDTTGSFKCTFPDGTKHSDVSISATDSDHETGNTATQDVTINNVAPTVTLDPDNDLSVNEGSTHTYTFTVTDPGTNDTFTASADYPDCDADATNNGVLVDGSYLPTTHGGSFKCFFPDGPKTAHVKMKVADSDGASATDSESVQIVEIANVAPTVTAPADQNANEGTSTSISLGSFTDPGPDAPWSVDVDWGDGSTHTTFTQNTTGSLGTLNHTYADGDFERTVTVKVTDKNTSTDTKTFKVTVHNVAPTVNKPADQTANEGTSTTISLGSFTDPGADSPWTVHIAWGDGTSYDGQATTAGSLSSLDHTYADGPADKTVTVTVTDKDNASDTKTFNMHVNDVAPTVHVTGDTNVNEGDTKAYTFTVADPGQDTFTKVAGYPSCDEGGTNGTLVANSYLATEHGGSFQCFFPDGPKQANVKMKVVDEDGLSGTDSESVQIVEVANVPPTVTAPADQTANEGTSTSFNLGSFGDPGADSPWGVDVNWGDGTTHGTTTSSSPGSLGTLNHTYADNGTYTATVTVTDKNGASDSKAFEVTVSNVAPTVSAPADDNGVEGQSKSFGLGSFTDPGANDAPWKVKVSWGDGSPEEPLADRTATGSLGPAPHAYADNGIYTVTVTVTDKDGGSDSKTYKVTVANVAPTATLSNNGPINEGASATISFTAPSDVPADAAAGFHYEFNCDGTTFGSPATYASSGSSSSTSCAYADNGNKTVRARVIDKDNGATEYTTTVAVNNVPPAITSPADQTGTEGSSSSYQLGSFTDANPNDGDWPVDVDWGDSSGHTTFTKTVTGSLDSKSHTYVDNGTYTVKVKVTDKDGGYSTKTFTITVANVKPTITSFTGTDYLTGPNAFILGGSATSRFTTLFTDPGSDQWTAAFTYADGAPLNQTVGPQFLSGGQTTHTFTSTGCKTASVKVTDDDGAFDTASTTIHVGSGTFQPPMTNQPVTDKLKNGQVLPVKVHITDCSGAAANGLTPAIRLVAGDTTPQTDDSTALITPGSVSAADTNGYMRPQSNGDYMYNMSINLPKLNQDYTVIVYPYATGSPVQLGAVQLGHVIQATK